MPSVLLDGRAPAWVGFLCVLMALSAPARAETQATPPPEKGPLTLERAIELALTRNERAQAAGERARIADAQLQRARAFFFPELVVSGTYTRRLQETVRNVGGAEVVVQRENALSALGQVRMTVLDARGFPLYRAAALAKDAAELDASEERRTLAFEAADAFVATLTAEQVEKAAEQRLALAKVSLEEAQTRFQAGLVSSNDVTKAQLEAATAERELLRARGDAAASYVNLSFLLAAEVKPPLEIPTALFQTATDTEPREEEWTQVALGSRKDLKSARTQAEAARARAWEPRLRLLPSLSLLGQYRMTNEPGLNGRVGDGFLSLELLWPLFDGGERYADARELDAQARLAELNAASQERRVQAELMAAVVNLKAAQGSLGQALAAEAAASKNALETQELYREGLATALDAAIANATRFDAQVALARERYALLLAYLDVLAAQGMGPLEGASR